MNDPADVFYVFYFFGSLIAVGMGLILVFAKVKE